jgi:Domain of unknown function (DUF4062)
MTDKPRYVLFVSSTSEDMAEYRQEARESVLRFNSVPIMMEYFPSQARGAKEAIQRYLNISDAVLIIAGAFYGSLTDHKKKQSFVEWEFDRAQEQGIPVVSFILSAEARIIARSNAEPGEQELFDKQERFIVRLQQQESKQFTSVSTFKDEISGALHDISNSLRGDAGLTRRASATRLIRSVDHLRRVSGFALVQRSYQGLSTRREAPMEKAVGDSRETMRKIFDLLHDDVLTEPAATTVVAKLMSQLIERLHGFSTTNGFGPESLQELRVVIDGLFGETLQTLKATSIHSMQSKLATYKGYWEDPELSDFFKKKNTDFLDRHNGTKDKIKRVFACDSLAHSVAEPWFAKAVIAQVNAGASVKIVEIDTNKIDEYEDFGIYEHRDREDGGAYLLLAPPARNRQAKHLRTVVTAHPERLNEYRSKFTDMWSESDEPLQLATSDKQTKAYRRDPQMHGQASINDLFENRVVLRNMVRLDNDTELLPDQAGFIRKYEQKYAEAVRDHLNKYFREGKTLFYVGDTYKNDGSLVRNLQRLGCNIVGFICEPSLGINHLWFNNVLYTDTWTDLVEFADKVYTTVGPDSVALFDIDQTLWSPKGTDLEEPLRRTRTDAMVALADNYFREPEGPGAQRARERVQLIYKRISNMIFQDFLTLDNEDYKAAICILLSFNLLWEPDALGRKGPQYFAELDTKTPTQFVDYAINYLLELIDQDKDGATNFKDFISQTRSAADTDHFNNYASDEIRVDELRLGIQTMFQKVFSHERVKYPEFRFREHEEALSRVGELRDLTESIVINKPAWDLASWFKQHGVRLLGISDRPDESTLGSLGDPTAERSLLNAKMRIYGREIADLLEA